MATRHKRIDPYFAKSTRRGVVMTKPQAVEMMAESTSRSWKYQKTG